MNPSNLLSLMNLSLMSSACAVLRQNLSQLLLSNAAKSFQWDHLLDPVLAITQTITQSQSSTSEKYAVIILVSLWLHEPRRIWSLIWFDLVDGYRTKWVALTSLGLKIARRGPMSSQDNPAFPSPPILTIAVCSYSMEHFCRPHLHCNLC